MTMTEKQIEDAFMAIGTLENRLASVEKSQTDLDNRLSRIEGEVKVLLVMNGIALAMFAITALTLLSRI